MGHFSVVARAFADSWARRGLFFTIQVLLRVVAAAIVTPLLGGLVNLAVSLSNQSALTDQDIALFIFSPVGFVVTIGVLSVFLLAEVIGFSIMSVALRTGGQGRWMTGFTAALVVLGKAQSLLIFAALLVLRIIALILPFALVGLLIAMWYLTEFDINYYLTFKPPEFWAAAILIGLLVLAMAAVLILRMSAWGLGLHLVLFANVAPKEAFAASAERMSGRLRQFQAELAIWLGMRLALAAAIAAVAGAVIGFIPVGPDADLKTAMLLLLVVMGIWTLAGLVLSSVSLGALAVILDGFFGVESARAAPEQPQALRRQLILVLAGGAVLAVAGLWAGSELLDNVQAPDEVEIIAHRGAAGAKPENTMAAVHKAIEVKADWVEIDVQETADGEVVVMHDSDFMKLAGVDLKIWKANVDDLADIDIGSWFDPAYADQRTPLLRDVLEMAKGTESRVLIELKYYGYDEDLEARVARVVEEAGMEDRIAVMSLSYSALQKMQHLRPEWRTGVLAATAVGNLAGLQGQFLAVNSGIASPSLIRSTQAAGKDLYVWTVNDPLAMSRMISKGVDGLITDEPELARKVLEARADLSTPERLLLWLSDVFGLTLHSGQYRDASP